MASTSGTRLDRPAGTHAMQRAAIEERDRRWSTTRTRRTCASDVAAEASAERRRTTGAASGALGVALHGDRSVDGHRRGLARAGLLFQARGRIGSRSRRCLASNPSVAAAGTLLTELSTT
jgi:hypothetical protein